MMRQDCSYLNIVTGPDNRLWSTQNHNNRIGRLDPRTG